MNTLIDKRLQDIADLAGVAAFSGDVAEPLNQRVAAALGWQQGSARLENLKIQPDGLKLTRGFLGPQRAAVFAANGASSLSSEL